MWEERSSFRPTCLEGKVAFVTGGGSGICKGIARQLLLHGAEVVIASRNLQKLEAAAQELSAETERRCVAVAMDVRDETQVAAALKKALQQVRTIDILVNGAGGNFLCSAAELKYKGFKAVMDIDAHGAFIVSKAVFDMCFKPEAYRCSSQLEKSSALHTATRGLPPKVIVNISATLHYTAALLQTHAGAAKAAVDALTRHLAVEWGPYNIRVNAIAPGPIRGTAGFSRLNPYGRGDKRVAVALELVETDSEMVQSHVERPWPSTPGGKSDDAPKNYDRLSQFVPLQRLGVADDVAYATLFLCLPEASFITGTTLVVDGGQWMTSGNFTVLEPALNKQWRQAPFGSAKL